MKNFKNSEFLVVKEETKKEFGQVLCILTFSISSSIFNFLDWLDKLLLEIIGLAYSSHQVNDIVVLRLL